MIVFAFGLIFSQEWSSIAYCHLEPTNPMDGSIQTTLKTVSVWAVLSLAVSRMNHTDLAQREQFLNTLLSHASALCSVKLLERHQQISPPSLDYRVTQLGRRIGNWETPSGPTLLKRAVFFVLEAGLRAQRYWKVVAIGAAGWAVVNAFKFYTAAFAWASHSNFAISSAVIIAVLAVVIKLVLSILHSR